MGGLEVRVDIPGTAFSVGAFTRGLAYMRFSTTELQNQLYIQYHDVRSDEDLLSSGDFDKAYPAEAAPLVEAEYGVLTPANVFFPMTRVVGWDNMLWCMAEFRYEDTPIDLRSRICVEALAPVAFLRCAGKLITCRDFDAQRMLAAAEKMGVQYDRYHVFEAKVEYLRK